MTDTQIRDLFCGDLMALLNEYDATIEAVDRDQKLRIDITFIGDSFDTFELPWFIVRGDKLQWQEIGGEAT